MKIDKIVILGLLFTILYVCMISISIYLANQYHTDFNDFIYNLNIFYSPKQLYRSLDTLHEDLIYYYPLLNLLDIVIAVLYGIFGNLLSRKIISLVFTSPIILNFSLIFILAGIVNILEDAIISTIFIIYPTKYIGLAYLASTLTSLKLILLILGIMFTLLCLVIGISRHNYGR